MDILTVLAYSVLLVFRTSLEGHPFQDEPTGCWDYTEFVHYHIVPGTR